MERLTIEAGGFTFDAIADGNVDDPLVILLHGFPESAAEWTHVIPLLASSGLRAVAFDQRGLSAGARPDGIENYHHTLLAGDVLAVASALGAERFHLVGHDWGALVAWSVAAGAPDRIETLSIVSVPHPRAFAAARADDPEQRAKSAYIEFFKMPDEPEKVFVGPDGGLHDAFTEVDPEIAQIHVRKLNEPGAMTAALNYYRAWDSSLDELGAIEVPTLFVWSTDDVAIGRSGAEATGDWIDAPYRFEIYEGLSHWIPEVAPVRLAADIVDHITTDRD